METHNILIQEVSLKETAKEDNSGALHQENKTMICLQSKIGASPGQLTEAQGCNVSNIQSDVEKTLMLLTENEDEDSAHPPSKKLKTEKKIQDGEIIADRIEDSFIDTQADKESESKINEAVPQHSDVGFLQRSTHLFPEGKNKNYENTGIKKIVISSDVDHNRNDFFSEIEKQIEAEETSEQKRVMKSKLLVAGCQEQTFMDQPLEKLYDQVTTLNEESHGKNSGFSLAKEINQSNNVGGSERNETASGEKSTGNYLKEIGFLLNENKNEFVENEPNTKSESCEEFISNDTTTDNQNNQKHERNNETTSDVIATTTEIDCGENNCVLPAVGGSERNEIASGDKSTGNCAKEIVFLPIENKNQFMENEPNTKSESCEDFISNDTTTDNQNNQKHERNNETSSDVIETTTEVECEENHCVLPAEKVNGEAETNLHIVIFEDKTSWTAMLQDEVFKLVDVPCDSAKYDKIRTLFQSTTQKHFELTKMVEVQNPFLYGCYLLKKAEMISRYGHIKEEYLFHGTKIENISSICEKNLDWRKHGSVTGNIFGKGASLTPISCYASHYSDKHLEEKIMFVFKVIIANETEGNPNMVLPPYKDTFKKLRYDTAIKPNRQVLVKFSDNEFYPEYLLYYTGEYRSFVDYYSYFEESDSD